MRQRNGIRILACLLFTAVVSAVAPAIAAAAETFTVTTVVDGVDDKECKEDCTLREAVSLAGSADVVDVPAGTYLLTHGELVLSFDTIVAKDARLTVIDGGGNSRVLRVAGVDGTSRVSGVTIRRGNSGAEEVSSGLGGGILVESGAALELTDSTVLQNTASTGGGIVAQGQLSLTGSTVSSNTATDAKGASLGGGIAVATSGGLELTNSTVSSNMAGGDLSTGGGVYSAGTLNIRNATFAANRAATGGGLYVIAGRVAPSLANTVLAAGTGGACGGSGVSALVTHHNVVSDDSCKLAGAGDRNGVIPQLAGLDHNGGPTNTHALLPASPAINGGSDCEKTDQRGVLRPQPAGGPCDVGAFEYRAPKLTVATEVNNDNGGTSAPKDVTVHVLLGKVDVKDSPQPGSSTGTTYTLDANQTYTVAAAEPGYSFKVSGDCAPNGNVGLAEGSDSRCTVTAEDTKPTLRVITKVANDDGGTLAPGNFFVRVRQGDLQVASGPGNPAGTDFSLNAGGYAVSPDAVAGYKFTYSDECAPAGAITLQVGQVRSCTVTAEDQPATLSVSLRVDNDDGGTGTAEDFVFRVHAGERQVAGGPGEEEGTPFALDAGRYVVSADAVAGYKFTYSGDCAQDGAVTLALGEAGACTITAEDTVATLRVVMKVVNDDGGTRAADGFFVRVRAGDTEVAGEDGSEDGTPFGLDAGSYVVSPDAVAGYRFTYSDACGPGGAVSLAVGETRSCTVTADDQAPTLRVSVDVVNDHGGTAVPSAFAVRVKAGGTEVAGGPGSSGTTYELNAGEHVVSVDPVAGYATSTSGDCDAGGRIVLSPGDARSCTITANDEPPPPPPPATTRAAAQEPPPPEAGETVNALPASGTVKVKLPGTNRFVELADGQQIPVGTVVDARNGHVTLVAAANTSGGTATAEFWAGMFEVGQTRGKKPITTLELVEKLSCPKRGKATAAAKKKKKKKRRLWGDGKGKFRTEGEFSSATVRGTKWLTQDSCTSTLTRVVKGKVAVRDFAKKRTVLVKAGKKYVAKGRR